MAKVTIEGCKMPFELKHGESLLELEHQQLSLCFGCCAASCGTCLIQVVDGFDNLSKPTENERETLAFIGVSEGHYRLACQCRVFGDIHIQVGE